jgi:SHAQKYF class myb-like DNA-binding protein
VGKPASGKLAASSKSGEPSALAPGERAKQIKTPWTDDEQRLFVEALELHGPKKMKELADHIGSRTIVQVRSHVQKYLLKESRKQQIQTSSNAAAAAQQRDGGLHGILKKSGLKQLSSSGSKKIKKDKKLKRRQLRQQRDQQNVSSE